MSSHNIALADVITIGWDRLATLVTTVYGLRVLSYPDTASAVDIVDCVVRGLGTVQIAAKMFNTGGNDGHTILRITPRPYWTKHSLYKHTVKPM
jgi:hypothetical protein